MAEPATRVEDEQQDRPPNPAWTRWLAAGTFVLGLTVGMLLVGLLGQDAPVVTTAQGAASASATGERPDGAEPTGGVELNEACLRAINAAQDIAGTVDDLGAAAAVLDAAALDEVIRRLQPLQQRLQENTAACEASGSLPSASATPSATPSPTG
jgi:hypothetical protein